VRDNLRVTRPEPAPQLGGRRAWVVYSAAVSIYVLAVFHRSSLGVAGLLAAERFHIEATQLSVFTMVQLLVYAAMQIPVGALLDRFGPKRLIITGGLLMTLAQLGFAFSQDFAGGILARVVLGIGDSMIFTPLLRIVALWFPPVRIPIVTQVTGMLGQLGALVAASPLVYALHQWGWSPSFASAAIFGLVLAAVVWVLVQDSPYPDRELDQIKVRALARAVRAAWRTDGTRLGLWSHFSAQFGATVFALLWGFPFLVAGEGLSPKTAGILLMLMTFTTVVASPLIGGFVTKYPFSRSTLILWIVVSIMAIWAVVLLWPGRAPLWLLVVLVVVTAVGGPGSMVGFDLARTFHPSDRLGRATGVVNIGGFTASLVTIALIGVVLDQLAPGGQQDYTLHDFRIAMSVQFVFWGIGIVQLVRYRRKSLRHLEEQHPEALEALRGGDTLLPGISRDLEP
jgi:sugar phosphate permease